MKLSLSDKPKMTSESLPLASVRVVSLVPPPIVAESLFRVMLEARKEPVMLRASRLPVPMSMVLELTLEVTPLSHYLHLQ